jgi:hypothetical protein
VFQNDRNAAGGWLSLELSPKAVVKIYSSSRIPPHTVRLMLIDMKKIITISATVGMSYCFEQMLNTI